MEDFKSNSGQIAHFMGKKTFQVNLITCNSLQVLRHKTYSRPQTAHLDRYGMLVSRYYKYVLLLIPTGVA